MDPEEAPETPAAGSEPSDDDILATMAEERQKKADDKLLGEEGEEKPAKPGKGKEGKGKPEPKPAAKEDDEDEEEPEESDEEGDDDSDDEDEDDVVPQGPRAKGLKLFRKGDVKGALKAALGLKDADLEADDKWEEPAYANARFRAFRKKQETANATAQERDRKQTERETNFRAYIEQKVKPAIAPAVKLLQLRDEYKKTRDPSIIVQIVEEFAEEGYDIVQKRVLKGEKGSAPDRRLIAQLETLKNELAELKKPKEETAEEKQARVQGQLQEYLVEIKEEIKDHDVRKLPGATKKVYRMLKKHYDPKLKAPKISIEKAADRVLKQHMRLLARLRPETAEPEKKKPAKVFAHSRSETREAAVTDDDPSDDDILRSMEIERARKRREEAKKVKGGKK